MRFGLGPYELGSYDGKPHRELYEEMLEQAALAEEMGFDSVWVGEAHFMPEGACPSAETAAAALAVRTKALRIGVLPQLLLTNPLYVAEDIAVLDCISNGRVIVAPQAAPSAAELSGYGVGAEGLEARFAEALEVLQKAWGPTFFAHEGKCWRFPGKDLKGNPFAEGVTELNVTPKPAQLALPVWIAAREPQQVEQAARLGFPWLATQLETLSEMKEKHERYAQVLAAAGRPTSGVLFPAVREVYVAETLGEAVADVEAGLGTLYQAHANRGLLQGLPSSFDALARKRFIVGDPDHVIQEIKKYRDEAGVNYLVCRMTFPGLSHAKTMAGIRFFGQAVVPEFRMVGFPSEIRKRMRES